MMSEFKFNRAQFGHASVINRSNRLCLRALQTKDASRVHYYRSLPEVSLYQSWTPANPAEVSAYAEEMCSRIPAAAGHVYQVVVELMPNPENTENTAEVIGDMAFTIDTETQKQAELGIAFDPAYQGQGYAAEAINALIEFLFKTFDLHRIHVIIDPKNTASLKLFARAGLRQEGHLRQAEFFKGKWCDNIIMALLQSEW